MPQDSVATVENFWREVWKQPQNPDTIDRLMHEDFVITSGGQDIVGREAFKAWVKDFQARVHNFEFHVVETFQNQDGSWTGHHCITSRTFCTAAAILVLSSPNRFLPISQA